MFGVEELNWNSMGLYIGVGVYVYFLELPISITSQEFLMKNHKIWWGFQ